MSRFSNLIFSQPSQLNIHFNNGRKYYFNEYTGNFEWEPGEIKIDISGDYNGNLIFADMNYDKFGFKMNSVTFNKPVSFPQDGYVVAANAAYPYGLDRMFMGCTNFNQPVTINQCFSGYAERMFDNCVSLNCPISLPNTIYNYNYIFANCRKFNQPMNIYLYNSWIYGYSSFWNCVLLNSPINFIIEGNDRSAYADLRQFFSNCFTFNAPVTMPLSLNFKPTWDGYHASESIIEISGMFNNCIAFNQQFDLPHMYFDGVDSNNFLFVRAHLSGMFNNCLYFDKPFNVDIDVLNASGVSITCSELFKNCESLNSPVMVSVNVNAIGADDYNRGAWIRFYTQRMFNNCREMNSPVDIRLNINSSNMQSIIFNFYDMLEQHESFNSFVNIGINLSGSYEPINLSQNLIPIDLMCMFYNCQNYNHSFNFDSILQGLNDAPVSIWCRDMFYNCKNLNVPIKISGIVNGFVDLLGLLHNCINFNSPIDLSGLTIKKNSSTSGMLSNTKFNQDLYIPDNYSGAPFTDGVVFGSNHRIFTHTISFQRNNRGRTFPNYSVVLPDFQDASGLAATENSVGATVVFRESGISGTVVPYTWNGVTRYTWDKYLPYINHD